MLKKLMIGWSIDRQIAKITNDMDYQNYLRIHELTTLMQAQLQRKQFNWRKAGKLRFEFYESWSDMHFNFKVYLKAMSGKQAINTSILREENLTITLDQYLDTGEIVQPPQMVVMQLIKFQTQCASLYETQEDQKDHYCRVMHKTYMNMFLLIKSINCCLE